MPRFCEYCGARLKDGNTYCTSCGKEVKQLNTEKDAGQMVQPAASGAAQSQTTVHGEPKKNKTWIYVISVVVLIFGILAGGYFAVGGKYFAKMPSEQKEINTSSSTDVSKDEAKEEKKTVTDQEKVKKYVEKQSEYNTQIVNFANDVNAFLQKQSNFKNEGTFIGRSDKVLADIKETHDAVISLDLVDSKLKAQLVEVLDDEKDRVQGLKEGITASKSNGDYKAGFQHGTAAAYKYDADNKILQDMLK